MNPPVPNPPSTDPGATEPFAPYGDATGKLEIDVTPRTSASGRRPRASMWTVSAGGIIAFLIVFIGVRVMVELQKLDDLENTAGNSAANGSERVAKVPVFEATAPVASGRVLDGASERAHSTLAIRVEPMHPTSERQRQFEQSVAREWGGGAGQFSLFSLTLSHRPIGADADDDRDGDGDSSDTANSGPQTQPARTAAPLPAGLVTITFELQDGRAVEAVGAKSWLKLQGYQPTAQGRTLLAITFDGRLPALPAGARLQLRLCVPEPIALLDVRAIVLDMSAGKVTLNRTLTDVPIG